MAEAEAEQLRRRVQSLPAELFNLVLDFVFIPSGTAAVINRDYKQPSNLRVSRATRESLILDYYSNTTFAFRDGDSNLLVTWLKSLSQAYRLAIRKVHITRERNMRRDIDISPNWLLNSKLVRIWDECFYQELHPNDALSPGTMVTMEVLAGGADDGTIRETTVEGRYDGGMSCHVRHAGVRRGV